MFFSSVKEKNVAVNSIAKTGGTIMGFDPLNSFPSLLQYIRSHANCFICHNLLDSRLGRNLMGKKRKNTALPSLPEGTGVIDSHCHLDMISGLDRIDAVVNRAVASGVVCLITVGIDLDSSRSAINLATGHESVYATVGIHPHKQRASNALCFPVFADGLTYGQDMVFVETFLQ